MSSCTLLNLRPMSLSFLASFSAPQMPRLSFVALSYADNVLAPLIDSKGQQEELVPGFHPLRYKDLPTSKFSSSESILELYRNTVEKRTASSVIINTASCLESSSLSFLQQQLEIPVYPIGPLHMVSSAPTSLLEQTKAKFCDIRKLGKLSFDGNQRGDGNCFGVG